MSTAPSVFTELGEKAFRFGLVFSLIATVYTLALVSGGVDPGSISRFFIPMSWLYGILENVKSGLPQGQVSALTWVLTTGAAVAAVSLQFLINIVNAFLILADLIADIVPGPLYFLIPPLYFFFAFLQFALYIYLFMKIREMLPIGWSTV